MSSVNYSLKHKGIFGTRGNYVRSFSIISARLPSYLRLSNPMNFQSPIAIKKQAIYIKPDSLFFVLCLYGNI